MVGFFSRLDESLPVNCTQPLQPHSRQDIRLIPLPEAEKRLKMMLASDPTSVIRYGSNILAKLTSAMHDSKKTVWAIKKIVAVAAEERYPRSALCFWSDALVDAPSSSEENEALEHIRRLKDEFVAHELTLRNLAADSHHKNSVEPQAFPPF